MLSRLTIYTKNDITYTFAYTNHNEPEYYLIDERNDQTHAIFLAKVEQVRQKTGLAWVNYQDNKQGIINIGLAQKLQNGSNILCQMTWSGADDKKPKLSEDIKLAGKYVILLTSKGHHYAKNLIITEAIQLLSSKYSEYGLIFRTALNKLSDLTLAITEIEQLIATHNNLILTKKTAPAILIEGIPKYLELLKNLEYSEDLTITTNDESIFNRLEKVLTLWQIDSLVLDKALKIDSLIPVVSDKDGIIIHKLSGINLIDINSQNSNLSFFQVNYLAVDKIIAAIKLNDLRGIILIDFIKNMTPTQLHKISDKLDLELKNDWRRSKVLGFTKAGICEIVRSK